MTKIVYPKCNGYGFCTACDGTGFVDDAEINNFEMPEVKRLLYRADELYSMFTKIRRNFSNKEFANAIEAEYANLKGDQNAELIGAVQKFIDHLSAVVPSERKSPNTPKPIRNQTRLNLGPIPSRNPTIRLPKKYGRTLDAAVQALISQYSNLSKGELFALLRANPNLIPVPKSRWKKRNPEGDISERFF